MKNILIKFITISLISFFSVNLLGLSVDEKIKELFSTNTHTETQERLKTLKLWLKYSSEQLDAAQEEMIGDQLNFLKQIWNDSVFDPFANINADPNPYHYMIRFSREPGYITAIVNTDKVRLYRFEVKNGSVLSQKSRTPWNFPEFKRQMNLLAEPQQYLK